MKGWAYVEKQKQGYTLFSFFEDRPLEPAADFQALMMSRLDFDVKVTKLPAMPEREIEGFLRYRSRSLYPGHPEETVFDYQVFPLQKDRYAALFLAQKATLQAYRRISGGKPLLLPFYFFRPLISQYAPKTAVFSFWHRSWIDLLLLEEDEKISSLVLKRRQSIAGDLRQIRGLVSEISPEPRWVIFCLGREREGLRAKLREDERKAVRLMSVQEALQKLNRNTKSLKNSALFAEKKKRTLPAPEIRLQVLVLVLLLFSAFLFKKVVNGRVAYLGALRTHLENYQSNTTRAVALQQKIQGMREELSLLYKRRPVDPYVVLSELEAILGNGTRIQSFILEKDFFQFEAIGSGPLEMMDKFKARKALKAVKLVQIVPIKDSERELFKITGRVNIE